MKTKIFLGCLALVLSIFSCQKEELATTRIATPDSSYQAELAKIKELIPDNVELIPESKPLTRTIDPIIFFPDTIITLTNCQEQQCYRIIPNQLQQMQRTANLFCQPMHLNICCCAKGKEWCFRFIINPQLTCAPLEENRGLLLEKERK